MTMGSGNEEQVLTMGDLLANYLAIAKRGAKYWKRGTALFLLIIIPGMYWVNSHARVFRSQAKFEVHAPETPGAQEQDMDTMQRSLEVRAGHVYDSNQNIMRVIEEMRLYPSLRSGHMSREKIVDYFRGAFTYRVDHDTIAVGFSYRDAETAHNVVERLVRLFKEERSEAAQLRAQGSLNTINSQLVELENTLSAKEESLEQFTNANAAMVEQVRIRGGGVGTTNNPPTTTPNDPSASPATRQLRVRISGLQRRLEALRNPTVVQPPSSEESDSVRTLRASVRTQQERITSNRARGMTEEHPTMVSDQRRLSELTNQLNGELGRSRHSVSALGMTDAERFQQIDSLQREINAARAQLAAMEPTQRDAGALPTVARVPTRNPLTLNTLPEVEAQYLRLSTELNTTRTSYQEMLQRKFQIQAELSRVNVAGGENIREIDPPSLPIEPEPPGKVKLGSIVGLVAIILGLGVSLISGFLDTRVYDQGDLLRWGEVPTLPFIPELHADGAPRAPVSAPGSGIPQAPA